MDENTTEMLAARLADMIAETGERMLPYFRFAHLPTDQQGIAAIYARAAVMTVNAVPSSPERTVALRKLLEAKDCAIRAL